MKSNNKIAVYLFSLCGLLSLQGCEGILEEPVKSQFTESTLLATKSGIESVLADAYSKDGGIRDVVKRGEMTTDIMWQTGGGENGTAVPLINFRWDSSSTLEAFNWMNHWEEIRNTNIVLANTPGASGFNSETERTALMAEARFLRAWAYYQLWDQFGPVPLRKSLDDPLELPRATDEEFKEFIESELKAVIPDLYETGKQVAYGRAHKGAAQTLLCIWYLNTHQWQNCANMAQEIISSNKFALCPDYNQMFALENERNTEFIWVKTYLANSGSTNNLLATNLPWDFYKGLDGGIDGVINERWSNFASQYRFYDDFYYSFAPEDQRKGRILTKYEDSKGKVVDLLVDYTDATRGMKYPPDPNASGNNHGNDFPFFRYAEVLLARAEALNELNGPNQESVDLINQIRNRASLDNVNLSDFHSKEELLEQLLNERKWEFWNEGKRRRDLIRTNRFIKCAHDRGITNAKDTHVWFPIPQSAIDASSLLNQNDGY